MSIGSWVTVGLFLHIDSQNEGWNGEYMKIIFAHEAMSTNYILYCDFEQYNYFIIEPKGMYKDVTESCFMKMASIDSDVYFEKDIVAEAFDPTAIVVVGGVEATFDLFIYPERRVEVFFTENPRKCKIPGPPYDQMGSSSPAYYAGNYLLVLSVGDFKLLRLRPFGFLPATVQWGRNPFLCFIHLRFQLKCSY